MYYLRAEMAARALLLLAAVALAAAFCGDGTVDYGSKQCDSGMRCVSRANTLQWTGAGPTLGVRLVTLAFRYAVQDYAGTGIAQLAYGVTITEGFATVTNQYAYALTCTEPYGLYNGIELTIEPVAPAFALCTNAVSITWAVAGHLACSDALDAAVINGGTGGTWAPSNLTSLTFRYNGASVAQTWALSASGSTLSAYSYGITPNTICGTECCTADCRRQWATVRNDICPLGNPTPAETYYCQEDGTCALQNSTVVANAISICGDGVIEPTEDCDNGLWHAGFNWASGGGTITLAPGSTLFDVQWDVTYSVLTPTVYYQSAIQTTYIPPGSPNTIAPVNSSYAMLCDKPNSTTMVFTYEAANDLDDYSPQYVGTWYYLVPEDVACTNWSLPPAISLLFQYQYSTIYDVYGNTTYYSTNIIVDALWHSSATGANHQCCSSCTFTGASGATICPPGTPATVPTTSTYLCQGPSFSVCDVTVSVTPTSSATPSGTSTPSETATETATPTPSASVTAAPSGTPPPSASPSSTGTPTQTPPVTPSGSTTASATPTAFSTPTPTISIAPSRTPQSIAPWLTMGALLAYTCATSLFALLLWYIVYRRAATRRELVDRERERQSSDPSSAPSESEPAEATTAPTEPLLPQPTAAAAASIGGAVGRPRRGVRWASDAQPDL